MARLRRAHVEHAPFGHVDIVEIIGQRNAIFDVGRLEGGRSLDERGARDQRLRQHEAAVLAEHVEAARPLGGLDADRNRKGARFEHRIRHRTGDEKPVVAPDRQPRHLRPVDRPVALQRILMIGIEPAFLDHAERFDEAPAVGHRQLILDPRKGLRRRRTQRADIVLPHLVGQIGRVAGAAAAFDDLGDQIVLQNILPVDRRRRRDQRFAIGRRDRGRRRAQRSAIGRGRFGRRRGRRQRLPRRGRTLSRERRDDRQQAASKRAHRL